MSLETVVEDIRERARGDAERILSEADIEGKEIVDKAKKEAAIIKVLGKEEMDRRVELEREQKFSSANLSAKQKTLERKLKWLQALCEERILPILTNFCTRFLQ